MRRGAIPPSEWLLNLQQITEDNWPQSAYAVFNGTLNGVAYPIYKLMFQSGRNRIGFATGEQTESGRYHWRYDPYEDDIIKEPMQVAGMAAAVIAACGFTDVGTYNPQEVGDITKEDIVGRLDPT